MDETLARVALDLSNRPYLAYNVKVSNYMIRDFNICLVKEFFKRLLMSVVVICTSNLNTVANHTTLLKRFSRASLAPSIVLPN